MSGLTYTGGGAFIPGIPARDLTEAEAAKYAPILATYPAGMYSTEAPQPAQVAHHDDLTRIKGIGPQVVKALRENGITAFQQLIDADPVELDRHLDGSSAKQIQNWQFQALQLQEI